MFSNCFESILLIRFSEAILDFNDNDVALKKLIAEKSRNFRQI